MPKDTFSAASLRTPAALPVPSRLASSMSATSWSVLALGAGAFLVLPLVLERHAVDLLVFCGLYAIAGAGVGFLLGQGGIVNLGQAAFYGIGGYASAYCSARLGWPALAGIAIGIVLSLIVAALIGRPILRLSGYFLALATLALGIICTNIYFEADFITGGTLGVPGVPKLAVGSFVFDTPEKFYYLVWPIAFVTILAMHNLMGSRIGLAMQAMRDAPDAAMVMAIDNARLKLWIFMLSSGLGALSGSLFAHYVGFVNVDSFGVDKSIMFLLVPVIGGASVPAGAIVGALFIGLVPELLSALGDIHRVLFGLALVASVVFFPDGLWGVGRSLTDVVRRRSGAHRGETTP
ncbi:branched-chain amino acid ABC transporter permease [Xanthobacter oligotrophicus]|uniref:branched-chain amino acid ABC transporter permease n=1 Tax=Xanthobacter oligotrophicus TaxID=2607286 RepID=UPI0011F3B0E8|nr:branched-chain amino acid ABC transporter permease [Xanthobacter oligotrophicus]MCG5237965.1 branched-chain amino acid ABC transporter permease [Xanthobacter oligotrophicus]